MREANLRLLNLLRCPRCRAELLMSRGDSSVADDVLEGDLSCRSCLSRFPIVRGIPRFTGANYASSFGFQWNHFAKTQLDRNFGAPISRERFEKETRWPKRLEGEVILEVGSGSGRFTEHLAATGAEVVTLDYSIAVEANAANNGSLANVSFLQASLYELPFEREAFDRILCIGVLQHTPDVRKAFLSLIPFLKPGGEIVIDVYRKDWRVFFDGKYYMRPLTKRLPPEKLLPFVEAWVRVVYSLTGWLHPIFGKWAGRLSRVLGVADYRSVYQVAAERQFELSVLDTFDMMSPAYDQPQSLAAVRAWFEEAGLDAVEVHPGYNGIEGRGRRRSDSRRVASCAFEVK